MNFILRNRRELPAAHPKRGAGSRLGASLKGHQRSNIWLTSGCLALIFFATGNFGFLNIFGIRREAQAFLSVGLFAVFMTAFSGSWRHYLNPIVLLALILLTREVLTYTSLMDIMSVVLILMVAIVLLVYGHRLAEETLKWILWGSALFSAMGLIQAGIFFFRPDIIQYTTRPYSSDTGSATVMLSHPIQYLGFNTAEESLYVFGHQFSRLNSFASEPSVLVSTFMAPAFLGLGLGGRYRVLALTTLCFVIGPVQSGTIWLSCALGLGMYIYLKTIAKTRPAVRRTAGLALLLGLVVIVALAQRLNVESVTERLVEFGGKLSQVTSSIESKTSSSNVRLTGMQSAFEWVVANPLGGASGPEVAGMALIYGVGYSGGYLGIALCLWLYSHLLMIMSEAFGAVSSEWIRIGICGCGGALLQAFFFSGYGWLSPAGFMVLTISYLIAESMAVKVRPSKNVR